ncbi:hypothetical protein SNOG_00906 [Parastagonospora nodorum SN15]|uniref:Uncharacterized protein n=1 Tax=Phaeosphaeria nodorum (strain SN15 / ATCC MYA-4574 / FGSC 10173) TaxID=321614 RepID=Q0V508_PHANO|nr:hypothetical protein SNOG_00906 [Parastagonospora nodorum SN15]EAT92401.1 hypothetical protein SNOG_00906 [Parastagonospora nodorum SN15]
MFKRTSQTPSSPSPTPSSTSTSSGASSQTTSWLSKLRPKKIQLLPVNAQTSPSRTPSPPQRGWFERANTSTTSTASTSSEEEVAKQEQEEELTPMEEYSLVPRWTRDAAKKRSNSTPSHQS